MSPNMTRMFEVPPLPVIDIAGSGAITRDAPGFHICMFSTLELYNLFAARLNIYLENKRLEEYIEDDPALYETVALQCDALTMILERIDENARQVLAARQTVSWSQVPDLTVMLESAHLFKLSFMQMRHVCNIFEGVQLSFEMDRRGRL